MTEPHDDEPCDCWDVHKNLDLDKTTCGCPRHREAEAVDERKSTR